MFSTHRQNLHKMCLWAKTKSAVMTTELVHALADRGQEGMSVVASAKTIAATAERLTVWKVEVNRSWLCIEQHPDLAVV